MRIGLLITAFLLMGALRVQGQDLEPRAYSPSPIGTNFLVSGYSYSLGDVGVDPSLPLTDVRARVHTGVLGYSRTLSVFERMTSLAIFAPYLSANVRGEVGGDGREVTRDGLGDIRMRIATNPIGGTALTPEEFAVRTPATSLGTSLTVVAPTGEYNSSRLVNVGSHRWAFKPEVGISQPLGPWFVEGAAGISFFTDNDEFFGGKTREQSPLTALQLHGGYLFSPGLWIAANGTYYHGGETKIDGVEKDDQLSSSRYGLTLSLPINEGLSLKIAGSKGLVTKTGTDFTTISAVLQYRWFD